MVKETKFYEQLGVPPDASEAQLKTAYKKGALKYHPDKNPGNAEAEHKFKELSHAYETLSDPQQRQVYDQYGEAGLEQGGGGHGGMSAEDMFSQFFGGGGGLGGLFGGGGGGFGRQQRGPEKAEAIVHVLKVGLEDVYKGKTSKLALSRNIKCTGCDGKGGKDARTCPTCRGQGRRMQIIQSGIMIQQALVSCEPCRGRGEIMKDKDRCTKCKGAKVLEKADRKVFHLNVEKGMPQRHLFKHPGEGDWAPGKETGDVTFMLEILEHVNYRRDKNDLVHFAKLDLVTALTGGVYHLQRLDESWMGIHIHPGEFIKPGTIRTVRGQGMPYFHQSEFYGDLKIHFEIAFPPPREMKDADIDAIRQAIPPRPVEELQDEAKLRAKQTEERRTQQDAQLRQSNLGTATKHVVPPPELSPPSDAMVIECNLEEADDDGKAGSSATMMDEDDEEQQGDGRVQCASQ